ARPVSSVSLRHQDSETCRNGESSDPNRISMRGIGDPAGLVQGVAMMNLFSNKKAEPPQPEYIEEVGWTQPFVLGKGFEKVGNFDALIGDDNTKRLFAELTADRDRADVRPVEAYQTILQSIHPGW